MYTTLLSFIKDKLFSSSGIVILGFTAIILLFITYNGDTILNKFGFETKTSLKGDLIQTKADLKRTQELNQSLADEILRLEENSKLTLEVMEELHVKKDETKSTVEHVLQERNKLEQESLKTLKASTVKTELTITMSKVDYEKVSKSNIDALNNAFLLLN